VQAPITLAVIPSVTPDENIVALDRLCAALGTILGRRVYGAHPASYGALTTELEKDRVQYAWMPPVLLALTRERIQLHALLSPVRGDRAEYCAALFVDARSTIRTLADARGATVAWVDGMSASGYLYPRLHLAAQGIDPTDLFGEELFVRSHAGVVQAVRSGRAAIGATYAQRPRDGEPIRHSGFHDVAPDFAVRVLEWTGGIPNDVIAGHGLLPWAEHREFARAVHVLTERSDGRRLLHDVFQADRFIPTPPEALRPLWELVEIARANGLLLQL